jgi:hypothetical protein
MHLNNPKRLQCNFIIHVMILSTKAKQSREV